MAHREDFHSPLNSVLGNTFPVKEEFISSVHNIRIGQMLSSSYLLKKMQRPNAVALSRLQHLDALYSIGKHPRNTAQNLVDCSFQSQTACNFLAVCHGSGVILLCTFVKISSETDGIPNRDRLHAHSVSSNVFTKLRIVSS